MPSKKAYIKNYGCQANVYDAEKIGVILQKLGYELVDAPHNASLVLLNTCHIREKAETKVLSDLGRLRDIKEKRNPNMVIGVCGCLAQAYGQELLRQAPFVSLVLGPQVYHRLPEYLLKISRQTGLRLIDTEFPEEQKFDFLPQSAPEKSSAFLSIQEGCDNFCTFCCVPYTRGAEYSRSIKAVLNEAQFLVDNGVKEITLLGQNVNAYHGVDESGQEKSLAHLIQKLSEIKGLLRIFYTTSHPKDMDDDLILAHGDVRTLMPYLHLPVQSGSNRVLKDMNRHHTIEDYKSTLQKLKKARSDMMISSDFIAGFPGETEEDHKLTIELISDYIDCGYAFKYSPRYGTPASLREDQIDEATKSRRLSELQDMLVFKRNCFNQQIVGRVIKVLVEKNGIGRSDYMQPVLVDCESPGELIDVRITKIHSNTLYGKKVA